jgi:hypothetical protein
MYSFLHTVNKHLQQLEQIDWSTPTECTGPSRKSRQ